MSDEQVFFVLVMYFIAVYIIIINFELKINYKKYSWNMIFASATNIAEPGAARRIIFCCNSNKLLDVYLNKLKDLR